MGTWRREAVREGRALLHTRLRGNNTAMGCWPGHGITSGMEQHMPQCAVPAQAPDPELLFLPLQSSSCSRRPAPT